MVESLPRIFVEDWDAFYGSPYLAGEDESGESARLVEDGSALAIHPGGSMGDDWAATLARSPFGEYGLAFVDGVRRGEAALYQIDPATGRTVRGLAGAFAAGVARTVCGRTEFGEVRVERLVIWGSGCSGALPSAPGGWAWRNVSIPDDTPQGPLLELQARMRGAEALLAEAVAREGALTLLDGPLYLTRPRGLPLVGYIKTHHRALLAPDAHARIPQLGSGERTSLFVLGANRYSCYLRMAPRASWAGPWSGVVRLEIAASDELATVVEIANLLAGVLPAFASAAHRDPRAPQNLVPIGALEKELRHRLGSAELARRAVREAAVQSVSH